MAYYIVSLLVIILTIYSIIKVVLEIKKLNKFKEDTKEYRESIRADNIFELSDILQELTSQSDKLLKGQKVLILSDIISLMLCLVGLILAINLELTYILFIICVTILMVINYLIVSQYRF